MAVSDPDRPPVLAHERFIAKQDVFRGLSLAQRFKRIHDTNLWGADTSISGLCRDCLVHLAFHNIERVIASFRQSGAKWLITTTFHDWQTNHDCEDGDWRALNLERAPFRWTKPLELLNENCPEAGRGWKDKSLGVWRLTDLPRYSQARSNHPE